MISCFIDWIRVFCVFSWSWKRNGARSLMWMTRETTNVLGRGIFRRNTVATWRWTSAVVPRAASGVPRSPCKPTPLSDALDRVQLAVSQLPSPSKRFDDERTKVTRYQRTFIVAWLSISCQALSNCHSCWLVRKRCSAKATVSLAAAWIPMG